MALQTGLQPLSAQANLVVTLFRPLSSTKWPVKPLGSALFPSRSHFAVVSQVCLVQLDS